MTPRAWCVLILVAAVVEATYDPADGRHNISMGERKPVPNDKLLFHDNPTIESVWLPYPKVQSSDVCYPPKGSNPDPVTITAFNITDLVGGEDGGYAFITDGGVGYSSLCLHLKTQRGKGYNFNIDIWGLRLTNKS